VFASISCNRSLHRETINLSKLKILGRAVSQFLYLKREKQNNELNKRDNFSKITTPQPKKIEPVVIMDLCWAW